MYGIFIRRNANQNVHAQLRLFGIKTEREREEKNISYYYKRQPKRTNVEKESRELNDDVDDEKNKIVAE